MKASGCCLTITMGTLGTVTQKGHCLKTKMGTSWACRVVHIDNRASSDGADSNEIVRNRRLFAHCRRHCLIRCPRLTAHNTRTYHSHRHLNKAEEEEAASNSMSRSKSTSTLTTSSTTVIHTDLDDRDKRPPDLAPIHTISDPLHAECSVQRSTAVIRGVVACRTT
jgi:hypothetical protein